MAKLGLACILRPMSADEHTTNPPIVLVIAGSDCSASAGLQADLKTVSALGSFCMTAVTAVTAQNSQGVDLIEPVPPAAIRAQLQSVFADYRVSAIKIGMLGSRATVETVAAEIASHSDVPLVLDPVMTATTGSSLIDADAQAALTEQLFPRATLLTPNAPEAAQLTGLPVVDSSHMEPAARQLMKTGCHAVLLKGGHIEGKTDTVTDLLVDPTSSQRFSYPYQSNPNTRGTGCTLSSAIACYLAQGRSLHQAVSAAGTFVSHAITHGIQLGAQAGPLGHFSFEAKP